jgi:hypothetical protein
MPEEVQIGQQNGFRRITDREYNILLEKATDMLNYLDELNRYLPQIRADGNHDRMYLVYSIRLLNNRMRVFGLAHGFRLSAQE